MFDKIKSSEICVHYGQVGANTEWNLFWNEQKILFDLNTQKGNITDANLCSLRTILDTPDDIEFVEIPDVSLPEVTVNTPVSLKDTLGLNVSGLVSYYPFDDSVSPNTTDVKSDKNGTIEGAANGVTVSTSGKFGNANKFDLSKNGRIALPKDYFYKNEEQTISMWVKPRVTINSSSNSIYQFIFGVDRTYKAGWTHFNDGKLQVDMQAGAGERIFSSTTDSWTGGQWYHIAITSSKINNKQEVWINGVLENTNNSYVSFSTNNQSLHIGSAHGCGVSGATKDCFDGEIDDVGLFDRALTPCEIKKLALGPDVC